MVLSPRRAFRERPLSLTDGRAADINILSKGIVVRNAFNDEKQYGCDFAMEQHVTQDALFESCCRPIVDAALEGTKGTIMVYGQTGTEKTHTMFGPPTGAPDGVVFHTMHLTSGTPAPGIKFGTIWSFIEDMSLYQASSTVRRFRPPEQLFPASRTQEGVPQASVRPHALKKMVLP